MEKWKLERNSQREVDALPGDDCRELADEEVEGVAGGGFDLSKCKMHICYRNLPQRPADEERLDCLGFYLN